MGILSNHSCERQTFLEEDALWASWLEPVTKEANHISLDIMLNICFRLNKFKCLNHNSAPPEMRFPLSMKLSFLSSVFNKMRFT